MSPIKFKPEQYPLINGVSIETVKQQETVNKNQDESQGEGE